MRTDIEWRQRPRSGASGDASIIVAAGLSLTAVAGILFYFHNRYWWPPDEGVYAYVAQRILAGDVAHRDFIDLHGGYGNLINAGAFWMFGEDLLSLRYPLVAMTFAQSAIAFGLLARYGALVAGVGAFAACALSFIQFLNPSANWHALFFLFLTVLVIDRFKSHGAVLWFWLGVLIGVCFLVRQLSGVFLAMGVVTWFLVHHRAPGARSSMPGRIVAAILGAGLAGYLFSKGDPFAAIVFGGGPFALIVVAAVGSRMSWATMAGFVAWMCLGASAAALPLAVYYGLNGALWPWLYDLLFAALLIHQQGFIDDVSFSDLIIVAVGIMLSGDGVSATVSAIAWCLLILAIPAAGWLATRRAAEPGLPLGPVGVLAPFWGLVAIHYQIPIYLFFVLPAVVVGILFLRPTRVTAVVVLAVSVWAIAFQAGQPASRSFVDIASGVRTTLDGTARLPRASLVIEQSDVAVFSDLLAVIEEEASSDEPLLTVPMDPELNFMTGRAAPVGYFATQLGLKTEENVAQTLSALEADAPLFVVFRRDDKYSSPLSDALMADVRRRSDPPRSFGPFDLFRFDPTRVRPDAPE